MKNATYSTNIYKCIAKAADEDYKDDNGNDNNKRGDSFASALVRVIIAEMEQYDQKQVGEESVYLDYTPI